MKKFTLFVAALVVGLSSALAQQTTPEINFAETEFKFGTVTQGEKVEHNFGFKNTSENPVVITNVRTTCGCTVPKWPREPIAAGEGADINAVFNTRGKRGYQNKVITISYTVKAPSGEQKKTTKVALKGNVEMPKSPEGQ